MNVRLGYACINNSVRSTESTKKVCCNKTCRLDTVIKQGINSGYSKGSKEYSLAIYNFLVDYGIKNLVAVAKILSWNRKNNIFFYRLSSDMFPHINNSRIEEHMVPEHYQHYFQLNFAKEILYKLGQYVQKYGIRLTMHPGHYNQLGTKSEEVLKNTFTDLAWHTRLLDLLERGAQMYIDSSDVNILKHGTLCIHGGGTFKNKEESIKRWKKNFNLLPSNIKRRICLENCEKGYSADDLLPICEELGIPLIFDFHHYACWKHYHPNDDEQTCIKDLLPKILKTWKDGRIPKFHLSDQAEGKNVGAHHDYVKSIPEELLDLMKTGSKFDIMIEAKQKELAVLKLYEKYKNLFCN